MNDTCVYCENEEEWNFAQTTFDFSLTRNDKYRQGMNDCIYLDDGAISDLNYAQSKYKVLSFEEFLTLKGITIKTNKQSMEKQMLEVLNKTYDNLHLRRTTVPLFMSNPGIGKTSIIQKFAKDRGVKLVKITLSQRMPNEVVGMVI